MLGRVSGFIERTGLYELTATKAKSWHAGWRYVEGGCPHGCADVDDVIDNHVRGRWEVEDGHSRNFWRITGPGLSEGFTADLWLAISGAPEERADRSEDRRWRF